MGIVIEIHQVSEEEMMLPRLLVYSKVFPKMTEPKPIGKDLADELLVCKVERRSMKLEQIFNTVLDKYLDGVIIKDIDVMFYPEYKVDVLKILIAARKRKKYSVLWPGRLEDGKLIYGEEGYPDYKVFNIAEYDVTCVR